MGQCFSLVRGSAMRVTALDGCGKPKLGACANVVSDGFVSVGFTANTDTGTEINVVNAAGKTCVRDTPQPLFTGYAVEIAFCQVNPELMALVTGQNPLYNLQSGEADGFTIDSDISSGDSAFALELWSDVPADICAAGSAGSFGYTLVPFLQGGVFGDFTIENDAVTFTVTGAQTKTGSGWGTGPYNVMPDATGLPAKLPRAIKKGEHLWVEKTSIAPPDPECDCNPNGTPATGATAGTPGTYTPTNSYAPQHLPITGLTASPATAWTTGQYIVLGDGSHAKWSGTTWIVA
jgi:hypothetical protein